MATGITKRQRDTGLLESLEILLLFWFRFGVASSAHFIITTQQQLLLFSWIDVDRLSFVHECISTTTTKQQKIDHQNRRFPTVIASSRENMQQQLAGVKRSRTTRTTLHVAAG
jgi:hypothetical protein